MRADQFRSNADVVAYRISSGPPPLSPFGDDSFIGMVDPSTKPVLGGGLNKYNGDGADAQAVWRSALLRCAVHRATLGACTSGMDYVKRIVKTISFYTTTLYGLSTFGKTSLEWRDRQGVLR